MTSQAAKSFPQSMLMINKGVSGFYENEASVQVIESKSVKFSGSIRVEKKGDRFLGVCLQKLLKTHVEKMSVFVLVQKLLINKIDRDFLKACY